MMGVKVIDGKCVRLTHYNHRGARVVRLFEIGVFSRAVYEIAPSGLRKHVYEMLQAKGMQELIVGKDETLKDVVEREFKKMKKMLCSRK